MKLLSFLTALMLASPALAQPVTFTTENYPPFVMLEKGKPTGSGPEITARMMEKAGLEYRLEVMPWARAIALAGATDMTCVFAAARTPEREKHFKWVEEPIRTMRNYLVRLKGNNIRATTLDDAKRFTVGTHRGDFTETLLKQKGFKQVDLAPDFTASVNKLLMGRIDLMPMSEEALRNLEKEGSPIESVVLFSESRLSYACNKAMPDDIVTRMSNSLAELTASGEKDTIFRAWEMHDIRP